MKIDAPRTGLEPSALQRLQRAADQAPNTRAGRPGAAGDRVELSSDAALASAAAKAAGAAPEVRQALVTRMQAALAAGTIGSDAGTLADGLIDRMTDPRP